MKYAQAIRKADEEIFILKTLSGKKTGIILKIKDELYFYVEQQNYKKFIGKANAALFSNKKDFKFNILDKDNFIIEVKTKDNLSCYFANQEFIGIYLSDLFLPQEYKNDFLLCKENGEIHLFRKEEKHYYNYNLRNNIKTSNIISFKNGDIGYFDLKSGKHILDKNKNKQQAVTFYFDNAFSYKYFLNYDLKTNEKNYTYALVRNGYTTIRKNIIPENDLKLNKNKIQKKNLGDIDVIEILNLKEKVTDVFSHGDYLWGYKDKDNLWHIIQENLEVKEIELNFAYYSQKLITEQYKNYIKEFPILFEKLIFIKEDCFLCIKNKQIYLFNKEKAININEYIPFEINDNFTVDIQDNNIIIKNLSLVYQVSIDNLLNNKIEQKKTDNLFNIFPTNTNNINKQNKTAIL